MNRIITITTVFLILTLTSCELVGDIFKAGVWSGIIFVVLIIAVVIFAIGKLMGGSK